HLKVTAAAPFPFAAFHFAPAGKDEGGRERLLAADSCRLSVVTNACLQRARENLGGLGIANAAGNGAAVLDITDRDGPFRDARDKFASSVQRVDNPDSAPLQPDQVVRVLLGQPSLIIPRQELEKLLVDRTVCFRDGIAPLLLALEGD